MATASFFLEQPFETNFDALAAERWMQDHWTMSITLSVVYCSALYLGTNYMKHRKPFNLQTPLIIWNCLLATFSMIGFTRMFPEFADRLSVSYEDSVCNHDHYRFGVTGFWVALFVYSKLVEFGDTAFLVLRKRPVPLLHWYHHVTVLMFSWHSYREQSSTGRWYAVMNYAVHSIMYSYYAARAAGVRRLPKQVPMLITILQIAQMLGGIATIVCSAYVQFIAGRKCHQSTENLILGGLMYGSYLLLFLQFFINTYMKRSGKYATSGEKPVVDEVKKTI